MNVGKNRLFFFILILFMSTQLLCSESTGTSSWFGGMYNRVKRYLNSWQLPKTVGGIPRFYALRSYNPNQYDVSQIRVPSIVKSAQYQTRKAEGATQEEFEKVQQNFTQRLQQHQLTPPRATMLESQLQARSAEGTREKRIVEGANKNLSVLERMIHSKQGLSIDQLRNLEESFKEVENNLASLKISSKDKYVEDIIARKDTIKQAFAKARSGD